MLVFPMDNWRLLAETPQEIKGRSSGVNPTQRELWRLTFTYFRPRVWFFSLATRSIIDEKYIVPTKCQKTAFDHPLNR